LGGKKGVFLKNFLTPGVLGGFPGGFPKGFWEPPSFWVGEGSWGFP